MRRYTDAQVAVPELGGPRGGLRAGEVEHPVGEVGHEATAGGDRDEVVGCDLAPVVVPPKRFVWLVPPDWLRDPTASGPGLLGIIAGWIGRA